MSGRLANRRIRLLLAVFALVFGLTLLRAVWLQGVQASSLSRKAADQHRETVTLPAGRGTIYDRTGVQLAIGRQATTVFADPQLIRDLAARFPKSNLVRDEKGSRATVAKVGRYIAAPFRTFPPPLDIRGTAFQTRVWQTLTQLRSGETLSYSQLAARVGVPGSARAVARACASNGIAVLVPCHRVVASDGALTGYKWGLERKRRLLQKEQAAQPAQPGVMER